jgi:hypothetical protein
MEDELRTRTNVNQLLTKEVATLDEGLKLVEQINASMSELLVEMAAKDLNNEEFEAYNNVRYDLKTARHNIRQQNMKLAAQKK